MTAPDDRIPIAQKLAYSLGAVVNNLQAAGMDAMLAILNLGLGMDPRLVGIVAFLPRVVDALSDPVLGYVSDKTRSRWGRRRPYLFCGALVSGVTFALMWQLPPGHSEQFYFRMCLIGFSFYFLIYTLYATPLIALGYEMTPDYHERTRVQSIANAVGQLVWIGAPWFFALMASDLFADKASGARVLALGIGAAMCVLGVVPAIFCRERPPVAPAAASRQQLSTADIWGHARGFFGEFVGAVRCRPFVQLCAVTFLVFNGFQLGASFTLYVLIYYVFQGDETQAGLLNGVFGTAAACCSLGVIMLSPLVSQWWGKRRALIVTLSISLLGYAVKWFGYNQSQPYWLLVACPFTAFGIGSLFTLAGSMVADACDYHELHSHQRREGVFAALYWWMVKVGLAIAGLASGLLLHASGFNVKLPEQTPRTLLWLRVFDVAIPIVATLAAIAIVARYPISETKARSIRAELERRRLVDGKA